MKTFLGKDRVVCTDETHPLFLKAGTVWRRLIRDDSAWVAMDEDIPADLRRFSDGDSRQNHVNLFPDQCEAEGSKALEIARKRKAVAP